MQPTMARLPVGARASAVRWSPDGGVLAVAVGGGLPLRSGYPAGRDASAASARAAERGSGQVHVRANEAEDLLHGPSEDVAAVLLVSASGAGLAQPAQCLHVSCQQKPLVGKYRPSHVESIMCMPYKAECGGSAVSKEGRAALHCNAMMLFTCTSQ